MSRIVLQFEFLPGIAEGLVKPVGRVLRELGDDLPRPLQEPEDPDLREIWQAELRHGFQEDSRRLLEVLADPAFGKHGYALEESELEALLRACSGLRFSLRHAALGTLSDEELEAGITDPSSLPPESSEGALCFWFLGALQELLVQSIDAESTYPDDAGRDPDF